MRLAAVHLADNAQLIALHLQADSITYGTASKSVRQTSGDFLAVGVIGEQNHAHRQFAAKLRQHIEVDFRLILRDFRRIGYDHRVGNGGDLGSKSIRAAPDNDDTQLTAKLVGEPARRAKKSLRAFVQPTGCEEAANNILHKICLYTFTGRL